MGFDLIVMANRVPQDLPRAWEGALAQAGYGCTFDPSFKGVTWPGGFLPITIREIRSGLFPAAHKYGPLPFWCGFELDVRPAEPPQEKAGSGEHYYFSLSTSMGRTVADLRLQCFAAATLAAITSGVVEDPQQDAAFEGEEALANAAREANEYETKWAKPDQWAFPAIA
jgi:hypothetical protein